MFSRFSHCCHHPVVPVVSAAARCVKPCLHGECVKPDKCLCHRGYKGQLCDEGGVNLVIMRLLLLIPPPSPVLFCIISHKHLTEQCFILTPDVNECGLPERPCSQRCVNTHGSYRCYCEPGYRLRADGSTCTSESI